MYAVHLEFIGHQLLRVKYSRWYSSSPHVVVLRLLSTPGYFHPRRLSHQARTESSRGHAITSMDHAITSMDHAIASMDDANKLAVPRPLSRYESSEKAVLNRYILHTSTPLLACKGTRPKRLRGPWPPAPPDCTRLVPPLMGVLAVSNSILVIILLRQTSAMAISSLAARSFNFRRLILSSIH